MVIVLIDDVATIDLFGLDNSIARSRTLISAAFAAAKLLETGELEARLEILERASAPARGDHSSDSGLLAG